MKNSTLLTKIQTEIMKEFYSVGTTKVIFDKRERKALWNKASKRLTNINFSQLVEKCPALLHQIMVSYDSGNNIQSAVFSECVYAQTLADMLNLTEFINCSEKTDCMPKNVQSLLEKYCLVPRYVYVNKDKTRMLIQAGGCRGVDCALINVADLTIYMIEFKEAGAKTSEPDLPKYGEDGKLRITAEFLCKYPQFEDMLKEQENLNFFANMGNNIHNFSDESIDNAVSNNYNNKKYAAVICTEDCNGNLVMLPADEITKWATTEGEIRPAGRNHYKVWTPLALKKFLSELGANISGNTVTVAISKLSERRERGGAGKISGYKINPLFFVYKEYCTFSNNEITFDISKVRQLNPTIAGKMFFNNLHHSEVYEYYKNLIQ